MKRRDFFLSSAALAAPFALRSTAAESGTGSIRLGVATYSLRQFARDNCIRMVNLLNVDYVDIKRGPSPADRPREKPRPAALPSTRPD